MKFLEIFYKRLVLLISKMLFVNKNDLNKLYLITSLKYGI